MKTVLKSGVLLGMFLVSGLQANSAVPILYCQDLPTEDLEVVEVEWNDQGTEILSRYRDGRTATTRLGLKLQLHEGSRIPLPALGSMQRELHLAPRGWVLRVFSSDTSSQSDVFCD